MGCPSSLLNTLEQNFHLEDETKYDKFPKEWDFQNKPGDKMRHSCHFLAQNWRILTAIYEGYCHTYDLPVKKMASMDPELFTCNVFCRLSQ